MSVKHVAVASYAVLEAPDYAVVLLLKVGLLILEAMCEACAWASSSSVGGYVIVKHVTLPDPPIEGWQATTCVRMMCLWCSMQYWISKKDTFTRACWCSWAPGALFSKKHNKKKRSYKLMSHSNCNSHTVQMHHLAQRMAVTMIYCSSVASKSKASKSKHHVSL